MQSEAALIDFDTLFGESIIGDHRIFDFGNLLSQARDAANTGFSYNLIWDIWKLAKLEAVLRRYVR